MKIKKVGYTPNQEGSISKEKETVDNDNKPLNIKILKSILIGLSAIILILLLYIFVFHKTENTVSLNDNSKKEFDPKGNELLQKDGKTNLNTSEQFNPAVLSQKFKKFNGFYFDVEYPDNFNVKPAHESISKGGYSSVFFTSPDGYVEFYVYAPYLGTDAPEYSKDIDFIPEKESIVQNEINKVSDYKDISYYIYAAKDSSYFRAYQETKEGGVRTSVIGLKYKGQKAYDYYKESYLKFKKSLVQYGD